MALSRIDLCSRALLKIGANVVSSLDEGTAEAVVANNLYDYVRDGLLSTHPWHFATAQCKLAALSDEPVGDYANAFALPADCLRVLSAGSGRRGAGLVYTILDRRLHTSASEVTLTYIFRANEEDFPPYFDKALIAHLAAEFCISPTAPRAGTACARWPTANSSRQSSSMLRR